MAYGDLTFPSWPQLRPTASPGGGNADPAPAQREQIAQLAREFESFFVFQMVKQMRQSMLEDENGQGLGAGTMTDTLDVELGRQLTEAGGIGLARVLQAAMERQVAATGQASSPGGQLPATGGQASSRAGQLPATVGQASSPAGLAGTEARAAVPAGPAGTEARATVPAGPAGTEARAAVPAGPAGTEARATGAAMPLPVTAPVSSAFGWRTDPFHGVTKFHAGIDIAAAYGREVPAAGAGQVVFSGVQGGYGNTVVIEHPGGIRTRYAHLASIQVEVGSRVESGRVIGRVGSSGRSTGSHLHFEVLQDGRPVNPEVAATRFAGRLKFEGMVADSPLDQSSVGVAAGVDDEDSGQ